ncbi:MAG: tetratricopeptide repeat protein [Gloeotrichia echinulata CP02]
MMRFEPKNPIIYYNRGLVYFSLKNMQNAENDFKKAAELFQQQGNDSYYQNILNEIRTMQR